MNFVWMILAFVILCGIALLFSGTLRMNIVEGMVLSASAIVLLLYLSSLLGTFSYGMYVIFVAAAVGIFLWAVSLVGTRGKSFSMFAAPAFLALLLLYICWLLLLHNDFIQHIDEFHQWAAAVRYMLEKDRMPTGYDFVGGGGQYGFATSLFHLFFQKISGYSEQNMYVSSMLLAAIGFLLPFSHFRQKSWKKVAVYVGIIYIGLFTLYTYGPKSMYVDVPTAAWAGGIAAWWMGRRKKRANLLIVVSGFLMLHFFKQSAGLLMALLMLAFLALHTFAFEKGIIFSSIGQKRLSLAAVIAGILICVGSGLLTWMAFSLHPVTDEAAALTAEGMQALPDGTVPAGQDWTIAETGIKVPKGLADLFGTVQLSPDKTQKTLGTFLTKVTGSPLASRSNLKLSFVTFLVLILFLFRICGDCFGKRKEYCVYMWYSVLAGIAFSVAVLFSYIFMFAYELSVELRSASRYFSIYCIYLFVILLAVLLREDRSVRRKSQERASYVSLGILVFLTLGLNNSFLPNATAIDKENISGYTKISETAAQIAQVKSVLNETDRVYFINQYSSSDLSGIETVNAAVLYYMEDQVSNYLALPWKYTSEGSVVRLENSAVTLNDFVGILGQQNYTYVWVYNTDRYLSSQLPALMACDEIYSNSLYRVCYENGVPVKLEFVMELQKELPAQ